MGLRGNKSSGKVSPELAGPVPSPGCARFKLLKKSDREIINRTLLTLLSPQSKQTRRVIALPEPSIYRVVALAKDLFLAEPVLLELDAPVSICGDTHGQFHDVLRLFEMGGFPDTTNYLFLGDYVDRAKQGIETILLLLCFRLKFSDTFFLLRGNHECNQLNRIYGFYDECKRRYNVKMWHHFGDCFNCMPLAALVGGKIFCVHGGISPTLDSMAQILRVQRPLEVPDSGLVCDLLWSDPDPTVRGWVDSIRGVSYAFGHDVIQKFCQRHNLDLICRAHQVVEDGYEFQANRRIVTVFSAPNYCGEFDNAAGMLVVSESYLCSFQILRPATHKPPALTTESSATRRRSLDT